MVLIDTFRACLQATPQDCLIFNSVRLTDSSTDYNKVLLKKNVVSTFHHNWISTSIISPSVGINIPCHVRILFKRGYYSFTCSNVSCGGVPSSFHLTGILCDTMNI